MMKIVQLTDLHLHADRDVRLKNVPTWAMLFSPLTGAENRHVTTGGYGRSGIGSLGQVQGIDFRRRAARASRGREPPDRQRPSGACPRAARGRQDP